MKRLQPWLLFLVVVLVPTAASFVYARDAYRVDVAFAHEILESRRIEIADRITHDIDASVQRAKAVVQSLPKERIDVAGALPIVTAGKPPFADVLSFGRSEPGAPLSSDQPGVRSGWFHTTFADDGSKRFWIGDGDDIVLAREVAGPHTVGLVFSAESVVRDARKELAPHGFDLEREPRAPKELVPELVARMSDYDTAIPRVVGRGQIVLNPRAAWKVVVRDRGQVVEREEQTARSVYRSRLAVIGAFVVIAFVLFVRGQGQKRLADLRTDYVAAVSHELRTPLASVRMFSELLEAEAVPAEERREVEIALATETRRLQATLERMVRFGALSRGMLVAERAIVPVRPLLEAAATRGGSRFVVEADPALEGSVDAGLLGHALDNLVGNANKYAPDGPVVLRARREGRELVIEVADRGPGLDARARRRIFKPFERADDRLSRATQGTGVGLALVDGIARAHGGRATVTSDHGATFTLRFPQNA